MVAEMPYAELQCALDDPPGFRNYWSAEHLEQFPDEAVELFCARAEDMVVPSPSQQIVVPWGGAVARNAGDWPLASRHALWTVHPFGLWSDPADDERGKGWARATCDDMKPYATGDVYLNFIGDEGEERVQAGFGGELRAGGGRQGRVGPGQHLPAEPQRETRVRGRLSESPARRGTRREALRRDRRSPRRV